MQISRITLAALAAATILLTAPAEARHGSRLYNQAPSGQIDAAAIPAYPLDHQARTPGARRAAGRHSAHAARARRHSPEADWGIQRASNGESYLAHPAGCPWRAFCACGASVEVFGHAIRELWPASAWYRFPRTQPAPGMVGVRSHHVFVLRSHIEGSTWLIADYNSGGHESRLHARSISGYTIVNPHGSRVAMRN